MSVISDRKRELTCSWRKELSPLRSMVHVLHGGVSANFEGLQFFLGRSDASARGMRYHQRSNDALRFPIFAGSASVTRWARASHLTIDQDEEVMKSTVLTHQPRTLARPTLGCIMVWQTLIRLW